jgi:hypothetical protein
LPDDTASGASSASSASGASDGASDGASIIDDHIRVFSFETAGYGKRKFLATSLRTFWKKYSCMNVCQRHYYEIIRENWPCRLYFDIEYNKTSNEPLQSTAAQEALVTSWMHVSAPSRHLLPLLSSCCPSPPLGQCLNLLQRCMCARLMCARLLGWFLVCRCTVTGTVGHTCKQVAQCHTPSAFQHC